MAARMNVLPADATITIHIHSDDLSGPTLEEVTHILIGVGQVIVGAWNVARLVLSLLSELVGIGQVTVGRLVASANPARADTLDLALMSLGMMLVGMGMLLAGTYL